MTSLITSRRSSGLHRSMLIANELLFVQGFEVLVEAPFLIRLLLELDPPDVMDHGVHDSLGQGNAAEKVAVPELLDTLH